MFTYIYIFDSLKIRSGTQIVIVGKKSGAQMGADPGVSTQVVVEPLLVRACLVLHTLKRLLGGNLDVTTKTIKYFVDLGAVSWTKTRAARPALERWNV